MEVLASLDDYTTNESLAILSWWVIAITKMNPECLLSKERRGKKTSLWDETIDLISQVKFNK